MMQTYPHLIDHMTFFIFSVETHALNLVLLAQAHKAIKAVPKASMYHISKIHNILIASASFYL